METKICSKCGKELPIEDFYWRNKAKGQRRSQCKNCHNNYVKTMYGKKQEDIEFLKAQCKCAKCGDSRGYVLDFHHKDPSVKEDTVSRLVSNNAPLSKIKEEIDKCVVLCANCHREFHYLEKRDSTISIEKYIKEELKTKYSDLILSQRVEEKQPIIWKQQQQTLKKNYCIDCGQEISRNATRCIKCAAKLQSKDALYNNVSREELKQLIRTLPFTTIAKQFKVTDNAIRKWCDKFNLPRTKKEINSYSNQEWERF